MVIPTLFVPLITNAILLYCGYASFKALETDRNDDDKQWLTFWLIYTLFAFAKSIADYLLFIIPFYNEASIATIVFLAFFNGARMAYDIVRPVLLANEKQIDQALADAQARAQEGIAQARAAAEEQICRAKDD
jgi:receptor expression-enhancing protein 5/6